MPDLGHRVTLRTSPLDGDGNAYAPAGLTLRITQPDGTTVTVAAAQAPSAAEAVVDWTPTQTGRHLARWLSTDGWADTSTFDVWPADPRMLFSLAEARRMLGAEGRSATSSKDELIRLYAAAVTPVIEDIVGPVVPETRSFSFDGGRAAVLLPPFVPGSLTVTVDGVTTTDVSANPSAGVVYAGVGIAGAWFTPGRQNVVVQVKVGMSTVPPNIKLAALEEFRYLWQVGQQAAHPGLSDGTDVEYTPAGYAVPRRVIELCGPQQRIGAIG